MKILEENIGRKNSDIPHSNIFTDTSHREKDMKKRINKWDYIKIKTSALLRKTSAKWKKNQPYLPTILGTRV